MVIALVIPVDWNMDPLIACTINAKCNRQSHSILVDLYPISAVAYYKSKSSGYRSSISFCSLGNPYHYQGVFLNFSFSPVLDIYAIILNKKLNPPFHIVISMTQ